ncbi:DUF4192 domain-containing protein [Nocardioides campestrisoli]|uniref:DUF4192 domain-containing protein n=1 Tax=Nocardioides campestrisoli TaxID=2736757 RepID=UPI0015E7A492|nr:DUF4192 domain-containing protein [Nocardioides campestrisoli]
MERPMNLTARSAEDLLACVPLVLGFVPQESVVMLGLGSGAVPHARVDLGSPDELDGAVRALVGPAVRHRLRRVSLFVFTDLDRALGPSRRLLRAFGARGIEVVSLVAYDGRVWCWADPPVTGTTRHPFEVLTHPFVTEAVVAGRVVMASREELARSLDPLPVRVAAVSAALARTRRPAPGWVRETTAALVRQQAAPNAAQTATLVLATATAALRDEAWGEVSRAEAPAHVDVWRTVLRSCPPGHAAGPAAVLAFLAWRAGEGALAWCAVEVAHRGPGTCSLTELVVELLEQAISPDAWPPPAPESSEVRVLRGRRPAR